MLLGDQRGFAWKLSALISAPDKVSSSVVPVPLNALFIPIPSLSGGKLNYLVSLITVLHSAFLRLISCVNQTAVIFISWKQTEEQ